MTQEFLPLLSDEVRRIPQALPCIVTVLTSSSNDGHAVYEYST